MLFLCSAVPATADWIVDINAVSNTYSNPVTLQLNGGSYTVTLVNQGGGGRYTAWNANSETPGWWFSRYYLALPGTTIPLWGGADLQSSAGAAFFANSSGLSFTLSRSGTVSFGIGDNGYSDNIGGVSLQIASSSQTTQVIPNPRVVGSGWIVDINAVSNGYTNPVGLQLNAGTYRVTPADQGHGGSYTAWNAASETPGFWFSNYYMDLPGTGQQWRGGGDGYENAGTAFAYSGTTSFTLSAPGTVYFGIGDDVDSYGDNFGGVSLQITSVPLPPGLLLLAPGLAGLAVIRKRFRK